MGIHRVQFVLLAHLATDLGHYYHAALAKPILEANCENLLKDVTAPAILQKFTFFRSYPTEFFRLHGLLCKPVLILGFEPLFNDPKRKDRILCLG